MNVGVVKENCGNRVPNSISKHTWMQKLMSMCHCQRLKQATSKISLVTATPKTLIYRTLNVR